MKLLIRWILAASMPIFLCIAQAADSGLRVTCEGSDVGAEVWINGKFRGECPVDLKVPAGQLKLLVRKRVDAERERVFEQDIRMGEDSLKKVEVQLPVPRLTAAAQAARIKAEQEAQAARIKAEQEAQARKQAAEKLRTQRIAASIAPFLEMGVEPGNGRSIAECRDCPELVLVPGPDNSFLAVGKYEVTVGQFAAFAKATNYVAEGDSSCIVYQGGWFSEPWKIDPASNWEKPGFSQTAKHPVVCVSQTDALAYLRWLSSKTGSLYQLPTIKQWSLINAGATAAAPKPWKPQANNNHPACGFGNFHDITSDRELSTGLLKPYDCNDGFVYTAPVGSFPKNAFGIHDLWGNAAELTASLERGSEIISAAGMSWSIGGDSGSGNSFSFHGLISSRYRRQDIGFRVIRVIDGASDDVGFRGIKFIRLTDG